MTGNERLKQDIAYVRAAAELSEIVHVRAYGFLWAAILLCGFALVDFADDPRWIGRYWTAATPVGFALSVCRVIHCGQRRHRDAPRPTRREGIANKER